MSFIDKLDEIRNDGALDYKAKVGRLREAIIEFEKNPEKPPRLKAPIKPKTMGMRVLNLSIHDVYFKQILKGTKKQEYRDYKDYYINKCTYVEGGVRYIVPFDALNLFVGSEKSATVAVTNITCDGRYFIFHLGKILKTNI
ncbi:MAG: hypothetical protein ACI3YI_10150 [Bacteroidaceae bacterium]